MTNPCPICDSLELRTEIENYHGYRIVHCINCGCGFCQPFKSPSKDFYTNAEDNDSLKRHSKIYPWPLNHPSQSSELFKNGAGKRLLDIGCGNGAFIDFCVKRNYTAVGIDIDTASLSIAQKRKINNAKFYQATLIQFNQLFPDLKFDIISAFEVIEHLDKPKETVALILSMLNPDGVFVGTLPNEHRFLAKKYNMEFALPPYHLTFWNKDTWSNVMVKFFGFNLLTCKNNCYFGYLSGISQDKLIGRFNFKHSLITTFIKLFFKVTAMIETFFEVLLNKSSSFYFEFGKPSEKIEH